MTAPVRAIMADAIKIKNLDAFQLYPSHPLVVFCLRCPKIDTGKVTHSAQPVPKKVFSIKNAAGGAAAMRYATTEGLFLGVVTKYGAPQRAAGTCVRLLRCNPKLISRVTLNLMAVGRARANMMDER